jgi:hypothetical protein
MVSRDKSVDRTWLIQQLIPFCAQSACSYDLFTFVNAEGMPKYYKKKLPCKVTRRRGCLHILPVHLLVCWSPSLPDSTCKLKPLHLAEFIIHLSFAGEITLFIGVTAVHMLFKHTDFGLLNRLTKILSFTWHVRSNGACFKQIVLFF